MDQSQLKWTEEDQSGQNMTKRIKWNGGYDPSGPKWIEWTEWNE